MNARRWEVYSRPAAGTYPPPVIVPETGTVDAVIDGQVVGAIAVADMLPRA